MVWNAKSPKNLGAKEKLTAAKITVVHKLPYLAQAVSALVLREVPRGTLNTMAVSPNGVLRWDAADLDELTVEQTAASLVHEVFHLLNEHHPRRHASGILDSDAPLWNVAADCEINDNLAATGVDMFSMVTPTSMGQPDGLTAEMYYAALKKSGQGTPQPKQGGQSQGQGQSQPKAGNAPNKCGGKCGSGKCGGGAGGEPADGEAGDKPGSGSGAEGRSAGDMKAVAVATAAAMQEAAAKQKGSVPGGWVRWAGDMLAPPKVRWQDKLRAKVRSAVNHAAGMVDKTYKRPNRRQAGLGYGAGAPVLAGWHAPQPRVMVALDTSGSMGSDDFELAMNELEGILKAMPGRVVDFVACDAQVHAAVPVRSWREAKASLRGGGGTSFEPVMEHITGLPAAKRPHVLVVATDGYGDDPPIPRDVRVIWLVTRGNYCSAKSGEHVYLDG